MAERGRPSRVAARLNDGARSQIPSPAMIAGFVSPVCSRERLHVDHVPQAPGTVRTSASRSGRPRPAASRESH
ncbi:hypothetical protein GCM10009679_32660 [Saccharothrix algeriensis]|uniref:Uncharacterized protein n=1 Tax=Catellatospora bangladeshensis TaxID=310355 RepID=A0A8J3JMV8_9ACTN|nr:hypothetical protein Cba03nite_21880 [Catellatospora bangladeshensis]